MNIEDGVAYTQAEFIEYYGEKKGKKRWETADPPAAAAKVKAKAKAKVKIEKEMDYSGLNKGMRLQVKEDGKYYQAEVVTVSKKKGSEAPVKIHWIGYTKDSDEWVGADRIRSKELKPLVRARRPVQKIDLDTFQAAAKALDVDISEILSQIEESKFLIASIRAREILDSRGNPTIEVDLTTKVGISVRAAVPSGASTGIHEACELRDGDKDRYLGKGVKKAVATVNQLLNRKLRGLSVLDQTALDAAMIELDGTDNKSKLGANAILGVSLAAAKAAAQAKGIPLYKHFADLAGNTGPMVLPVPCFNVINGGSHAGNKLAFQEYFVIPVGADTFKEALRIGAECYHTLKGLIKKKFGGDATLIGDEGGFAPPCDARQGLELVMEAIEASGHKDKCSVGMDVAASEFKVENEDCYDLGKWYPESEKNDPKLKMTSAQLADFYAGLIKDFPIIIIEDPFDQDDWAAWKLVTDKIGVAIEVVGDDLTVTNVKRVKRAIDEKSCNALLLKVNQIGTVSESIDAVKMCKKEGWGIFTSHRSGETEDTTIADLSVGLCTGHIKTGAPCRSERNAKYNQLMRIEEELGSDAVYAGKTWRKPAWMA